MPCRKLKKLRSTQNPLQIAPELRSEDESDEDPNEVADEEMSKVAELLDDLQGNSKETAADQSLGTLDWKDFPALHFTCAKLSVESKNKKIDVFFQSHLTSMLGTLNLYLHPLLSFSWRQASLISVKAASHGVKHARNVCTWIHAYLHSGNLPIHQYGVFKSLLLEDEDLKQAIQLQLQSIAKDGYIKAQDIVDFIATDKMQVYIGAEEAKQIKIGGTTAHRCLKKMDWQFGRK